MGLCLGTPQLQRLCRGGQRAGSLPSAPSLLLVLGVCSWNQGQLPSPLTSENPLLPHCDPCCGTAMAAEPIDPTLGVSSSRGPWAPGGDPWSQSNNGTGNGTSGSNGDQPFFHFDNIISLLTVLISLCGAAGNGAVVWLLRFRLKRKRFSVYILNLACADIAFLLLNGILYTVLLLRPEFIGWGIIWALFQLIRLGLLVAVSIKRCVSGLGPLRHQWPCLNRFSSVVGLLICVLAACLWVSESVCEKINAPCDGLDWAHVVTVVISLLVLCVSSLTLLVRVQCGSRGTRLSRLDISVLLTVLAFLLLGLPYNVHFLVLTIAPDTEYVPGLWETLVLLSVTNSMVNPVIYFLVRRYLQWPGRTSHPKGAPEGTERRHGAAEWSGTELSTDTVTSPEVRGESCST